MSTPPGEILRARLARYFGTTPRLRMNLQANCDLAQVAQDELDRIETRAA